MWHSKRYLKLV